MRRHCRRHLVPRLAAAVLASPVVPLASAAAFRDRLITWSPAIRPGRQHRHRGARPGRPQATHPGPEARIVVENRPGAAGAIASEWRKRQPPDGHTPMVTETGSTAAAPAALVGGTRHDPLADFTRIGVISTPPAILVVTERFPGAMAAEVLAHLRDAPPESLTYASSGAGGVLHLRSERLAQTLGTSFVHVPYRSGLQMLQAILTGEAQLGGVVLVSATPLLREGKVRGMAMMGTRRLPLDPDIPTFGELGLTSFEDGSFFMLIAPAGLSRPVAEALSRALVATLAEPQVQDRLLFAGHNPYRKPNGLAEARDFTERALAQMRDIVERTGIRLQP